MLLWNCIIGYGLVTLSICTQFVYASYNLTCYSCVGTVQSDSCIQFPNASDIVTCAADEPFCQVLRITDRYGDLISLTRGCTSTCKNHCGIWGEEVDEERCHSCCKTHLCNVGNISSTLSKNPLLVLVMPELVLYIYCIMFLS